MRYSGTQWHRSEPGLTHEYDRSHGRRRAALETQRNPVRESAAVVRAESRTNLTVVTDEGDRITLSLAAQAQFAGSSYDGPNGRSLLVSSQLRVSVKGDLSEAELRDLEALFHAVGLGGSGGSDVAGSFAGLESLAAFEYTRSQTVTAGTLFRYST